MFNAVKTQQAAEAEGDVMTVTIEVMPELAHRWREIAEREGRALEAVAAQAAEVGTPLIAARENSKRQLKGFGKFAHIGVSVDTHHALKREEIVAEAAKIARRSNNDLGDAA